MLDSRLTRAPVTGQRLSFCCVNCHSACAFLSRRICTERPARSWNSGYALALRLLAFRLFGERPWLCLPVRYKFQEVIYSRVGHAGHLLECGHRDYACLRPHVERCGERRILATTAYQ